MRDWLWPIVCAGCGAEGQGAICPDCLPPAVHRSAPPSEDIRGAFVLTGWDQPLGRALAQAKYGRDRSLMCHLATAFTDRLAPAIQRLQLDAVVPAPSAWTRRLYRGFSPAAVLAAAVSRRTGVPMVDALTVHRGPKQASLRAAERRTSLQGRVRSNRAVPGTVLLIDDIWTTGATARACSRELLGERTTAVWLAALCTRRPDDSS